jgi:hypothetical protein
MIVSSVEQMAQGLDASYMGENQTTTNQTDSTMLLWDGFETAGHSNYGHLSAGYRFYWNKALMNKRQKKRVWAIQTEYLWHDIQHIDQKLGGSGSFGLLEGAKESHGSEKHWVETSKSSSYLLYPFARNYGLSRAFLIMP